MSLKLILAGGGTGGHLFPGLAVASEWKKRGGEVLFVGTPLGLEKDLIPRHGFALQFIEVSKLKGAGFLNRLKTFLGLPKALRASFKILRIEKPDVVLGIGGYASGPLVLAAYLKRLPTAIMEQNAYPGLTNRILGRFAQKIFLSFEKAQPFFNERKVLITGNPILARMVEKSLIGRSSADPDGLSLLVCGGSQGAHRINEVFLDCVESINKEFPTLRIIHQTGTRDYEWVSTEVKKRELKSEVAAFFHDLDDKYASSSLVIARSGAGTVTELALWGLPSILIPFPYAADDHQKKNAEALVSENAAVLLEEKELNKEKLLSVVRKLLSDQELRKQMSVAALKLARPNAAKEIVDQLIS